MSLERRYRILLLAYPLRYRRGHGTEILTTLLDAATPGRARPTWREAVDVVWGGLRQRFRLPWRWPVFVAAVMGVLTFGALGAAGGALGSHLLAPDPPGDAAARVTFGAALGVPYQGEFFRRAGHYGPARSVAEDLFPEVPDWTVDGATARLTEAGWHVDSRGISQLTARRGGLRLEVAGPGPRVSVAIVSAEPATTPAAAVLGWLAGAVFGWLFVGWLAFRRDLVALWALLPLIVSAYWTYALVGGQQPLWVAYTGDDRQTAVGLVLVGAATAYSRLRPRQAGQPVIESPVGPRAA